MSNKKEKIGSIYFDNNCKKWRCAYYVYDKGTSKEIRKPNHFQQKKNHRIF